MHDCETVLASFPGFPSSFLSLAVREKRRAKESWKGSLGTRLRRCVLLAFVYKYVASVHAARSCACLLAVHCPLCPLAVVAPLKLALY